MALRHPVCGQPSVDPLTDPEGFGRLPELPLENAVEVLLGGKPAGVGDLHGTAVGGTEHLRRAAHADIVDVIGQGRVGCALEELAKIGAVQQNRAADLIQCQRLVIMFVNEADCREDAVQLGLFPKVNVGQKIFPPQVGGNPGDIGFDKHPIGGALGFGFLRDAIDVRNQLLRVGAVPDAVGDCRVAAEKGVRVLGIFHVGLRNPIVNIEVENRNLGVFGLRLDAVRDVAVYEQGLTLGKGQVGTVDRAGHTAAPNLQNFNLLVKMHRAAGGIVEHHKILRRGGWGIKAWQRNRFMIHGKVGNAVGGTVGGKHQAQPVRNGAGVANGISIDGGREVVISGVAIKNTPIGIHVKFGINGGSSDADISFCNIIGTGTKGSKGIFVEGYDNTFTNIRIGKVHIGVHLRDAMRLQRARRSTTLARTSDWMELTA